MKRKLPPAPVNKKPKQHHIFTDLGVKQLTMPADTHHLFCNKCLENYKTVNVPDRIIFVTMVSADTAKNDRGIMPVIKAFSSFVEYTSGVPVEWAFVRPTNAQLDNAQFPLMLTKDDTYTHPVHIFKTFIMDLRKQEQQDGLYVVGNTGWYASCGGFGGRLNFKQKALMVEDPETALTYMCHEITAHAYDVDVLVRGGHADHYITSEPHNGHCATGAYGSSNCLNGFIDGPFANLKNALPFFKKWYDDHKDDPITMYGSPAPSPALRRRLGSPAPSPAPLDAIDVELMAVEMMPIDNKAIISNPGGPLTDFTSFDDFYDVIRNAPSYEGGVNRPTSKMTVDSRGQLINAKHATKHFNAYVEKAKEIYGISGDADWANNDEDKEPVYVSTYQLKRGHTLYGIGDLHSGIHSLTSILREIGVTDDWKLPDKTKVVFCGDYLDRGPYSIECLYAVTKLHINNPYKVVLIEGNHEDHSIFNRYGAKDEMVSQYSEDFDAAYEATLRTLRSMPTAVFLEIEGSSKAIQFCHGGMVSEDDPTYSKIKEARDTKRLTKISSNDLLHKLKWADFGDEKSTDTKTKDTRPKFSVDSVAEYCNNLNLHGIISGHQDNYAFQIQAHAVRNYPPHFTDEVNQIADRIRESGGFADHIRGQSGLVIDLLPTKSQVVKLGEDTQSIITSAATPTRYDIKYPSFIRIRT